MSRKTIGFTTASLAAFLVAAALMLAILEFLLRDERLLIPGPLYTSCAD
jgi:hypothetical protein